MFIFLLHVFTAPLEGSKELSDNDVKTVYDAILTELNEPIFRHSSTPSDIQQLSQTDAYSLINHIASFKTI